MSFEATQLSELVAAVSNLQGTNSALAARYAAAAAPTMGVAPAAGDVISAVTAAHLNAQSARLHAVYGQAVVALDILARVLGATVAVEAPAVVANLAKAEPEAS
ncbi:PE domain-containing protein [Mycobacterium sp. 1465703.0]|uniref:PE domain-containing protein n=1 Tax=Mycobacterium sp. 1465703.0 TaxID=1834078 RepID=UPI0008020F66|nr:PE domain-containing protein [Mycobacterium sp. 1465703.0]OBJ10833.1 hypothetical protein A5625_10195 [Mycobacterium sp. 1465703.0]